MASFTHFLFFLRLALGFITAFPSVLKSKTSGQREEHRPHPTHFSSSTFNISEIIRITL